MYKLHQFWGILIFCAGLMAGSGVVAQSVFDNDRTSFPLPVEAPPTAKYSRNNRYLQSPTTSDLRLVLTEEVQERQPAPRSITLASAPMPMPKLAPGVSETFTPIPTFESGQPLTLNEVRFEATLANPALQQLAQKAEAKRGEWVQAGLKENPMIGYAADEMTKDFSGKHGIELSHTIIRKYKINARQAAASRDFLVARQVYEVQCQKVVNDALLVAYKTAVAQRKCSLLHVLSKNTQDSLQSGKALLDGKEISRADYLELKIQAERTRIALQDARIAYHASSKELALLLGRSPETPLSITDTVEILPPELNEAASLAELLACSPEIHYACKQVESAKAVHAKETAEAGIDIDANASVLYNTDTKDAEVSVGVAVPLRIFNRNQGNIQRARAELVAAQRNVDRVRLLLSTRFQKTLADYQSARNRVLSYEQSLLKEAQESFELSLNAYKHGEYSSLELLNSQRTLIDVKVEHLDSLAAFWEAQTLIQGALLSGGLEAE